jgi:hypothetical protein
VPVANPVLDTVELSSRREDEKSTVLRIRGRWNDPAGQANYYRLYVESFTPGPLSADTFYNGIGTSMMNDLNSDGRQLSAWVETFPVPYQFNYTDYDVYLLETDEHYFRYHDSRLNDEGDNPFAEPNIMYSNVNGGLGCFGSYVKTVKRVRWYF